jgi:hypothetical protein
LRESYHSKESNVSTTQQVAFGSAITDVAKKTAVELAPKVITIIAKAFTEKVVNRLLNPPQFMPPGPEIDAFIRGYIKVEPIVQSAQGSNNPALTLRSNLEQERLLPIEERRKAANFANIREESELESYARAVNLRLSVETDIRDMSRAALWLFLFLYNKRRIHDGK